MPLTIWGRRNSYNVQKVLWLIDELALSHTHIPAGGSFGLLETPAFRARNPHGRVPVIEEDGRAVWESHAILRYLAARHGRPAFWADDPAERAGIEAWMDWAQTELQPAFLTGVFWGFYRTPAPQRDAAAIAKSVARSAALFSVLDRHLADRAFIGGASLSLADIAAGVALFRYFGIDIERPPLPNVLTWYGRLQERPAFRAHVMRPFDDLFGRLAY